MQDGSIKKLVYEVLCSKVMPPLQARLDQECSDTPSLVFTKQAWYAAEVYLKKYNKLQVCLNK